MARTNVVILPTPPRKRSFTSAEAMIEEVRNEIFRDGETRKAIALRTGVATSTINNIATGKTRWPRHTTLFPLLNALNMELRMVKKGSR